MAIFAVILLLITDRRAHPGRLWAIPVLVLCWANIHGSFFLGPVVLGLAWLEDVHDRVPGARRLLILAVVSVVAACVTPFGPAVWAYALGLSTNPEVTARITEWQPTSIRNVPGMLFFASAFAVVVLIARRGRTTPWPTLAWLAVFFLIGVYALRGVAWWPLGTVAAIAGVLITGPVVDPSRPEPLGSPLLRRLNAVVAIAIIVVGVVLLPVWRPIEAGLDAPQGVVGIAPPGITADLADRARPGDRVFNPQPWGSWFEFALPDLPVAIDSRIELFPPDVWDTYENIVAGGDGWATQLRDWGVTIVVVAHRDAAMAARLPGAGWQQVYADADGSVWIPGTAVTAGPRDQSLIDREDAGRGEPDLRRREAPAQREIRGRDPGPRSRRSGIGCTATGSGPPASPRGEAPATAARPRRSPSGSAGRRPRYCPRPRSGGP